MHAYKEMSRQPRNRKKLATRPTTALYTALETIQEDEDLVTTLSTDWQGPKALSSKAFQKASKRGRRRKLKVSTVRGNLRVDLTNH